MRRFEFDEPPRLSRILVGLPKMGGLAVHYAAILTVASR